MAPTVQCLLVCFDIHIKLLILYREGIFEDSFSIAENTDTVNTNIF